tara:strand:- start:3247 stop:5562 length:2316 start_codon:yes stop_codon:yes gene_type:complete
MLDLLKFAITAKNNTGGAFAGVKKNLGGVKGMLAGVQDRANRVGKSMRNIGAGMSLGVTAPLVGMGKQMVSLYDTQVQAEKTVATAIASTGSAAGKTLSDLKGLASGLQEVTTYGDEDILRNVTAPLLTFTKIQGDVFDRAQANVLDYATLLKTDLKSASIQVGKALNDPIKGVSALGKAGVQFTDEQKGMIKSLVETGDVAAAQGVILKELETQFKGQAAAAAGAPMGQWVQLGNLIGDVKEQLGAEIVPFLKPLAVQVKSAVAWFSELSPEVKRNVVVVGGLAAAVGPLVAGLGLMVMGVTAVGGAFATMGALLLANPIFAAVAAIAGGAYLIYRNWDGISAWFAAKWQTVKNGAGAAWEGIKSLLMNYTAPGLIYTHWDGISEWFSAMWDGVKTGASAAWEGIKTLLMNYTAPGLIYTHWGGITEWFANTWDAVKSGVSFAWDGVKNLLLNYTPQGLIYQHWGGIGAWFSGLTGEVVAGFQAIWGGVAAEIAQWPDRMKALGRDVVSGLAQGIKENPAEAISAISSLGGAVVAAGRWVFRSKSPSKVFMGIGKDVVDGLAIGITANANVAVGAAVDMTSQLVAETSKSTNVMGTFRDGVKGIFTSVLTGASDFKGALSGMLGSFGNNLISGGVSQLFDTIWPFAKGGVINSGNVVPFAKGGVVSSPTTFGMTGNRTGLMGEAGPEAIIPLSRGSDGSLGVRADGMGGGGGSVVQITYAPVIDARGADQAAVARLHAQLEAQAANLEANVIKIMRNGVNRRTVSAGTVR